jgi:large subunit ribosomal protein L9
MKLLLTEDIQALGIVGDVVEVSDGYARNYLLPQRLGVAPTEANMRALAEERKRAEERRRTLREAKVALAEKLKEIEVTIAAAANPDGVLYGSVGPREISAALKEEGYEIQASEINLHTPIKRLDNVMVQVRLAPDVESEVKVWVVRSRGTEGLEEAAETEDGEEEEEDLKGSEPGMEAGEDGYSPDSYR